MCLCVFFFIKKRPDYLTVKEKYIKEWEEIRNIENNNQNVQKIIK